MKTINSFTDLIKERLKKVKTYIPTTLFDLPPDLSLLRDKKCPMCGNKLTILRGRPLAICKGLRHPNRKSFIISTSKLAQILAKNELYQR